jgi:hypothetical protein
MWTKENRGRYDRSKLRYPSDLTDEEWAHVAPLISPAKRGGNKRTVDVREIVNGPLYVLSTGCQWRPGSAMLEILAIAAFTVLMISVLPIWSYSERWGYIPILGLMAVATAVIVSQILFEPI